MLDQVNCQLSDTVSAAELLEFYGSLNHPTRADEKAIGRMLEKSTSVVVARVEGKLVGVGRGICDGIIGYLVECKLSPTVQGPAAVTRVDGRIEHDEIGIARSIAKRVLQSLRDAGAESIRTVAYGTEVDFCEELGFKREATLVPMSVDPAKQDWR